MNPLNEQLVQDQIRLLKREVDDLRYILHKKIGGGSADVKARVVSPSTVSTTLEADSVGQSALNYEQVNVTVSAGNPSGTATVTSGSIIIGYRPTGNNDALVDNIAVSGTTLTLTLAGNATADNFFQITLLKS